MGRCVVSFLFSMIKGRFSQIMMKVNVAAMMAWQMR